MSAPLDQPAVGQLRNGDTIDVSRTTDGVEVEQVFGALSLLLNGGGISQLHDISRELDTATAGHEPRSGASSRRARRWSPASTRTAAQITDALDALAALSKTLRSNDAAIGRCCSRSRPGSPNSPGSARS